jgi:UDP-N-acetylmuramoyl-tripeptide--D-alanyl-D-alanine ligase
MSLEEIRTAVGGVCDEGVSPSCVADVPSASVVSSSFPSSSVAVPEQQSEQQRKQQDAGGTPARHADKMSATHAGETPATQGMCLRDRVVTGISTDSRHVKPGDLFIAIKGEKFDAHAFLGQVFQAGAAGAIVNREFHASADLGMVPLIAVDDTIVALGKLGAYHRDRVGAKVIAVTGSNGKTTTKRMIQHILAKHLRGTCSPKSFNNNIGVPLTLLGAGEEDEYVICEVGSNAPGEIAGLSAICRPDLAVITSVGETHLEKLGSIDLVAVEKASMLHHLRPSGCAIVWADSAPLAGALNPYDCRMIRFGQTQVADLRLTDFQGYSDRVCFRVNGKVEVRLPQPGLHNASNSLAALAVATQMGVHMEQAAADLSDFGGVEMRLESLQIGPVRVINDAYNANPSSMLAAADVLAGQPGTRRVMIAGDMLELGPDTRRFHERVGADIAALSGSSNKDAPVRARSRADKMSASQCGIDLLIGIGELGRYIAGGARSHGLACQAFDTMEAATAAIPSLLQPGDVILIKGSRGAALERLIPPLRKAMENK